MSAEAGFSLGLKMGWGGDLVEQCVSRRECSYCQSGDTDWWRQVWHCAGPQHRRLMNDLMAEEVNSVLRLLRCTWTEVIYLNPRGRLVSLL